MVPKPAPAASSSQQCAALIPPETRRGFTLETPPTPRGTLSCTAMAGAAPVFNVIFQCERGRSLDDFKNAHDSRENIEVGRSARGNAYSIELYAGQVECEVKLQVLDAAHGGRDHSPAELIALARAIDGALTPETAPWPTARIAPRCDLLVPAPSRLRLDLTMRLAQRAVGDSLTCIYGSSDHRYSLEVSFDCETSAAARFSREHHKNKRGAIDVALGAGASIDEAGIELDFVDAKTGCWVQVRNWSETDPAGPATIALARDIEVALTRAGITPPVAR